MCIDFSLLQKNIFKSFEEYANKRTNKGENSIIQCFSVVSALSVCCNFSTCVTQWTMDRKSIDLALTFIRLFSFSGLSVVKYIAFLSVYAFLL